MRRSARATPAAQRSPDGSPAIQLGPSKDAESGDPDGSPAIGREDGQSGDPDGSPALGDGDEDPFASGDPDGSPADGAQSGDPDGYLMVEWENIFFEDLGTVANEDMTWSGVKSLYR